MAEVGGEEGATRARGHNSGKGGASDTVLQICVTIPP
jgi:hypothetical protein